MVVLILGGTVFLGRHVVEALLARGHDPVLFTRGLHGAELFPQCERITGDRTTDIHRIGDRRFDAVVDTSGYMPAAVRASAEFLKARAERYLFVSSVSVYRSDVESPQEDSPLDVLESDGSLEAFQVERYGGLKALCEAAARVQFGEGRTTVVRPGLIVGPHDPTDRFTYWPLRVGEGGAVLAPGDPSAFVQFIDARDLATWTVTLLERAVSGTFNAVSPPRTWTFESMLEACRVAARSHARFVWVSDAFLEEAGVEPWMGLPLWLPASAGAPGLQNALVARALETGLRCRPIEQTTRDTLEWARTRDAAHEPKAGISRARERELLQAWSDSR